MYSILLQYHEALFKGLLVTSELLIISILIGISFGCLLGYLGARLSTLVSISIKFFSFILSSIPVIVLLFWFHYPMQSMLNIVVDPFWTAAFSLSLINTIMTADLVLRELKLFPNFYIETGKTLGLTSYQIVLNIEAPILLRRVLPQLLTNQANLLQLSLLTSFISVSELFRAVQNINAQIYKPVEVYTLLVLFFILILGPINLISNKLKNKYAS